MSVGTVTLSADQLEQLADLIAARLTGSAPTRGELVDAATVARALGITRQTVYAHGEQLGGRRIGEGPRAPWRFDLEAARAASGCCSSDESPAQSANANGASARRPRRAKGNRARGMPPAGSVLASRPRVKAAQR
jgi:hypothetical protein